MEIDDGNTRLIKFDFIWKLHPFEQLINNFRRLADLQEQLTDLQQEFDVSKEECLAHQTVIQELKHNLEEVQAIFL